MRAITLCPACQTQFFVTQDQLTKHDGQVRCGHCLHVFDANAHKLDIDALPSINNESNLAHIPLVQDSTLPVNEEMISVNPPIIPTNTLLDQPLKIPELPVASRALRWLSYAALLLAAVVAQSVFFLRSEIASYYPPSKPYLVQLCQKLACSIHLLRNIELIVIDDSDIKEDTNYPGLLHVSSTLVNQAKYYLAYPNIELTLTDIEDKPKLRRIFKPEEYLPASTDVANGIPPTSEVKINLAIMAQGHSLAGYRVLLTY
jgi:predicted Zn finger-like uncharacterized protein